MVRTIALTVTMAQEEDEHTLQDKFAAAVKVIRSLPREGPFQLSDDMNLMFYSYYMQATSGPCTTERPFRIWERHQKAQWDKWNSLGNMTKAEAMKKYVENIQLILETVPVSNEVSDLVQQLGNFYTEVECEENEVDSRPFTRPFAKQEGVLVSPKKPALEGYGGLWNDIQDIQEKDSVHSMSSNGDEAEGCKGRSEDLGKEDKNWTPPLEDEGWWCDTRASSSSMEPSVSSLTNATHSSLNSEIDEEELPCSVEPSICSSPIDVHFNGHLSDHKDIEENDHPADSENEEFCDSMEDVATEKMLSTSKLESAGSPTASVREQDLWFESSSTLKAEDSSLRGESCPQEPHNATSVRESPKTACISQPRLPSCDSASQCARPCAASWGNVDEQVAAALLRLQDDMAHVLHRLRTLEELSVTQGKESRSSSSRCEDPLPVAQKVSLQFLKPSWWPFDHSPVTVVMTALWPAIAYGLVQLYSNRRRRKIP
ncbi:acyl-CoA-binding domain-containing protein 5-B-like isoform X2 [Dunckerocampus dactyliophorus]|uniref:acyl-CoA-binding domain-containing protein 5-B-like isoform X2 n=1 Tax=Dunckerocampus dactyliophorus TaxID=161453 RepID=UPI00240642BF|nr:acyl-CoA-binding domain-containing protein 5-B-like isoform X2 [Dunckerocampus dactyliophorus]